MYSNANVAKKEVEFLFSERNDIWLQDVEIYEGETLSMAIEKLGFTKYVIDGLDPDDETVIHDGMTVRVRVWK